MYVQERERGSRICASIRMCASDVVAICTFDSNEASKCHENVTLRNETN